MSEPYRYLELLASFPDGDGPQTTYVLRQLDVDELVELARDLDTAEQHGEDIEEVLAVWASMRAEP